MKKINLLKRICFVLLLQTMFIPSYAQSDGSIYLETYLTHVYANLPTDYENYHQGYPHYFSDVYVSFGKMYLRNSGNGSVTSGSDPAPHYFFYNYQSDYYPINATVIQKEVYKYQLGNSFNLQSKNSLKVEMDYNANEDDHNMQPTFGGDDDFPFSGRFKLEPYINLAQGGDNYFYKDYFDANLEYPYYFRFRSRYILDALEPQLRYTNAQGADQIYFCEGETMKVKVIYKRPFHNGYFRWERKDGNGNWYFIGNSYGDDPGGKSQSITQVATSSNVQYRARLIATGNSYGVNSFRTDNKSAAYTSTLPNSINVFNQIDGIEWQVYNVCPSDPDSAGVIELTNILGGETGAHYSVILNQYDTLNNRFDPVVEKDILDYHPDSLATYDLTFSQPAGRYSLGVFNNDPSDELPCGFTREIMIINSVDPEFTAGKSDEVCFEENGKLFFQNIQLNPGGLYLDITATSNTGAVFSKRIYNTNDFLSAPPGIYTMSAQNDDNCFWQNPATVEIIAATELTASVAALPSYEVNGITYHGSCAYDRFDAEITIAGGASPYTVQYISPFSNYNRSFTLLENEQNITIPELFEGTNYFIISDRFGCTLDPIPFVINNPAPIQFPTLTEVLPTTECGGVASNGSITSSGAISGGFPPYILLFDEVEVTTFDSMGLANTRSRLSIIDSLGCRSDKYISLVNNSYLWVEDNGELPEMIPCGGSITYDVVVTGGTANSSTGVYEVLLNGIPCADNPNCSSQYDSDPFNYFGEPAYFSITVDSDSMQVIEVTDHAPDPCTVSISHQFEKVKPLETTGVSAVPPACSDGIYQTTFYIKNLPPDPFGGSNYDGFQYELDGVVGSATLNTIDGTPSADPLLPLEFTIPVAGDGLHEILVQDNFGCGNITPFEFSLVPVDSFIFTLSASENLICNNDSTGSFSFNLNGDFPYQVELFRDGNRVDSITLNADDFRFSELVAGTYTVNATDLKGCNVVSNNIILTEPNVIQATLTATNTINCSGQNGIIEVSNVTGGTPPYSYSLNGQPFQINPMLKGGGENNTVVIKDALNCFLEKSITVPLSGPTLFSSNIALLPDAACEKGTSIIEVQAGFTFPLKIALISDPTNYNSSPLINYGDSIVNEIHRDTMSNLMAGTYYYLVSDGLGCELVDSFTVATATPLSATVTAKTDETCHQQSSDGTITITATGGQPPYMMALDTAAQILTDTLSFNPLDTVTFTNSYTVTGLEIGHYSYVVEDARGCVFSISDSIVAGSLPQINSTVTNYQGCAYETLVADIGISGNNGNPNYTYLWEDGNTDSLRLGIPIDDYKITVTDALGCSNVGIVIFDIVDTLNMMLVSSTDVVCQADTTGQVILTTLGGFPPYQFSLDGGNTYQADSVFMNLGIGTYAFLVKDTHDCLDTASATITFTNPLVATVSTTNALCKNGNDGTLEITVGGGVAPFSYSIDNINFQAQNTFAGLTAGTYSAWVMDGSGCKAVYHNNIITEPTILTLSTSLVANEACNQMNGSASGTAAGGTPPYTYRWNGDANFNNPLLENAAAGLHTLKVTDANFCSVTKTVTIGFEAAPTLILENSQAEICGNANGQIDLNITNGTAPFTFQWSHDGSLNDSFATNLVAGNYSVTISDANACTDFLTTSIIEIVGPSLMLENSQPEICGNANGQIDLTITNGTAPFTFQWSHDGSLNDSLATNLTAGNYSITISDANACTDILTTSINETAGPTLSVFSKTNSLCVDNNGEIVLATANGTEPFTYVWSHDATLNNNTATNLSGGNYSTTITDANGCSDIISTNIDFDHPQIFISSNITHAVCDEANGAIQLSVSGGAMQPYTYNWSHDVSLNATLASELLEGNYSVTVSDAQGCSSVLNNIMINNSPAPVLSIASFNNTDCLNPMGNITVQTSGGTTPLTYAWSHDASVTGTYADGLNSGNYTITVTDGNGCNSIVTQSLIEFEGDISITNSLDCSYDSDGSLLVTLQGDPADYNYAWSDAAIPNFHIASNLSGGTYTVTVTNSNGCTQDFSIDLSAPDEILPNISSVIPVGCGGNLGSATATPTGGTGNYIYNWNDPNGQTTPTANDLPVGNYSVLIIDANGCTAFENVEIIQSAEIILTEGTVVNPLCHEDENGSVEVIASQGFQSYSYLWSDGQITPVASNLGAGDYTVTVTDEVGCTQTMTTTIDEPAAFTTDGILIQTPLCFEGNEGEVTVSVLGGTAPYQYQWDDDLTQTTDTATNLVAGNYNVTITDINGCSIITEVEVTQPTALQITSSNLQKPTCVGNADGTIEVFVEGGTADYQYILNGGGASNNNTFTNLEDGIFTIEIIDNNGCSISENLELEDPDSILLVTEILTPVSCEGTPNGAIEILAEGGDQNISYAWSNGMSNNSLENLTVGNYDVSITDGLGCEVMASYEIESIDLAPLDLGASDTLLCNNGVLYYDFSNTDYVEFSWGNLTEGELSNAPKFTTLGEDVYYLHALRNDGCLVEDSIRVNFTSGNLDAFFIAPTDIVVGDTIVALELTLPIPDGVEWEYDENNIELVEQRGNQYLFYFSAIGEYDLTLISSLGGCQSDISKTIFVYADSTQIPFVNATVPTITELNLFPNPNDGIFTINVELANVNDMVIDIFNHQSMLVNRDIFTGKDIYSKNYELELPTGIYYVIVQVAGARRSLTFVID